MGLAQLTRDNVLKAIAEFDRLGREEFLRRHGFGQSRSYLLRYEGRLYDSKAIVGVAHGFLPEGIGALTARNFSGGAATVQATLSRLGFEVISDAIAPDIKEWRETFQVGAAYTREQVADAIGYPIEKRSGGTWSTGYTGFEGSYFIFCNVGGAGRTGHDYPNRWQGRDLVWFGKTDTHVGQPQIDEMVSGRRDVLIFWRARDRSPFTFAGVAHASEVVDSTPVEVLWSFDPVASIEGGVENMPVFRRGPRPKSGERRAFIDDGPCSIYLMTLEGLPPDVACGRQDGFVPVKVGMSSAPQRRLSELNAGFPPGARFAWRLKKTVALVSLDAAFEAESKLLEELRVRGYWIGGEFGAIPEVDLPEMLAMMGGEDDAWR
jgi:hypothetical protein